MKSKFSPTHLGIDRQIIAIIYHNQRIDCVCEKQHANFSKQDKKSDFEKEGNK